jgi:hypothetical protein
MLLLLFIIKVEPRLRTSNFFFFRISRWKNFEAHPTTRQEAIKRQLNRQ